MAMDNCPALDFFGPSMTANGCASAVNIVGNPGFFIGVMFDIQNMTTSPMTLHGLTARVRNADSLAMFYTTAPGSHVPVDLHQLHGQDASQQ